MKVIKAKYEESITRYKQELDKIAIEKERLAADIQNCSSIKSNILVLLLGKIEEERIRYNIEINQWKEALLELATFTIKSEVTS